MVKMPTMGKNEFLGENDMYMPKIEKFTVSRDDSIMEGWPDLIKTQSGRLLLFYNECTAHSNRDGTRITMRKSDDKGKTWSKKYYIGEETQHGNHWNSIRVNILKNGKIVLVCDKICGDEKLNGTYLFLCESTDDGENRSKMNNIGISGYCADKVRELNDGSLLLCTSVHNVITDKTEIYAHKSFDGGKTWSNGCLVAASDKYTFIEPAVLQLNNGHIAVFIRENSLKGYNGFVSFSYDNGESFSNQREIPIEGMHRPFVGYLSNGNILLTYREHLSVEKNLKYPDLKGCIFAEKELLESNENDFKTFLIDHDRAGDMADQGYSAWVQHDNEEIFLVNYIVDDAPKAYIRGYRIEIG